MAHVIQFKSSSFDPTKEPPNPIDPIAWLIERLLREDPGTSELDVQSGAP